VGRRDFFIQSIATGVLITFTTFQVAWAAGPQPAAGEIEKTLLPETRMGDGSFSSAPPPTLSVASQTSNEFLAGESPLKPVIVRPAEEQTRPRAEIGDGSRREPSPYDRERYALEDALELMRPDFASAVILERPLSSEGFEKLREHSIRENIEIAVLILHGETILLTVGSGDEIAASSAAREILEKASFVLHTHPSEESREGPTGPDLEAAGDDTHYLLTVNQAYAYDSAGIEETGGVDWLTGRYLQACSLGDSSRREPSPGNDPVAAREDLNRLIAEQDKLNQTTPEEWDAWLRGGTFSNTTTLTSANVTTFPGSPYPYRMAGSSAATALSLGSDNRFNLAYDVTAAGSSSGLTISFDNASTSAVETQNLSTYASIVFGLQGAANSVKVQFVDLNGNKDPFTLTNLSSSQERFWNITTNSLVSTVDKTRIKQIDLFVDPSTTASNKRTGTVSIRSYGLNTNPPAQPVVTSTVPAVTNQTSLTLSGTKDANSSLLVNGVEVVPLNSATTWSSTVNLSTEGNNTLNLSSKNSIGKISTIKSFTVLRDTVPPTGSVTINNNATYAGYTNVTLTLTGSDVTSGLDQMRFSLDGGVTWTSWEAFAISKALTLPSGDGTKEVRYQLRDKVGLVSTFSDTIILDTVWPSGTLRINNDAPFTNSTAVTLNLSATDATSGVGSMRFSNDLGTSWTAWEPYATTKSFTLLSGEGTHYADVQYRDRVGWVRQYRDAISLDTTPPAGSVKINNDAAYATSQTVTLNLTASDSFSGIDTMHFSIDAGVTWTTWEAFAPTKTLTLPSGDGTKEVRYQVRDKAGNAVTSSDTILLDLTGPSGSVAINSNATYTNSQTVTLTLAADDGLGLGVERMSFSTDNVSWTAPEIYATSKTFTLPPGDGNKTVWVKYFDKAGNVGSVYSKSIILDTLPPSGTVAVNGGASWINQAPVILNLAATDAGSGLDQMSFSSDNVTWTPSETYAATKSWSLSAGDGNKTVYAKFQDRSGLWSSPVSITVLLDTTAPTGSLSINSGALYSNVTPVSLNLSALDSGSGIHQMSFSTDQVSWTASETYATSRSFTLPSGDGTKTLYVKYADQAGNVSAIISKSILLDTMVPSGSVKINNDALSTNFRNVTLTLTGGDTGSGLGPMHFSVDGGATWTDWENFSPTRSLTLSQGGGIKEALYEIKDQAGNISRFSDQIQYIPPPVSIPSVNAVPALINTSSLTLSGTKGTDTSIWVNGQLAVPIDSSSSWTYALPLQGDGLHSISITARDADANESSAVTLSTTLDLTPPQIVFTSPAKTSDPVYLLSYTVDGIPTQETRFLEKEGDNVLSVTKIDLAGNKTTQTFTVTLEASAPSAGSTGSSFSLTTQNGDLLQYVGGALSGAKLLDGTSVNRIQLDAAGVLKDAVARLSDGSIQVFQNGQVLVNQKPDGSQVFYSNGEVQKIVTKEGITESFTYTKDSQGTIVEIQIESDEFLVAYDNQGRMKSLLNKINQVRKEYINGMLAKIIFPDANPVVYSQTLQSDGWLVTAPSDSLSRVEYVQLKFSTAVPEGGDAQSFALKEAQDKTGNHFFFEKGILTKVLDPQGNVTSLSFQESPFSNLTTAEVLQNGVTSQYDAEGKLSQVKVNDLTVHYRPDQSGIESIEKTDGTIFTDLAFDASGNLTNARIVSPDGAVRIYANGSLVTLVDPDGTELQLIAGKIQKLKTPDKLTYTFTYTADSVRADLDAAISVPDAITVVRMEYDASFTLKKMVRQNGEILSLFNNQLVQVDAPSQAPKVYSYEKDAAGNLLSTVVTQGNVETRYDAQNQPVQTLIHPTSENPHALEVHYRYGKIREVLKDGGLTFKYSYEFDASGKERTVIEDLEEKTVKIYEDELLLTSFHKETQVLSTYSYSSGKVSKVDVTRLGKSMHTYLYTYEGDTTVVTDEAGIKRTYGANQKLQFMEKENARYAYSYSVNPDGEEITEEELIERKLEDGSLVHYEKGRVTKIERPDGSVVTDLVLNEDRIFQKATITLPSGTKKVFSGTSLLEEIRPDGTHFYFVAGKLTKVTDAQGQEFLIDSVETENGFVKSLWVNQKGTLLQYDADGHLLGIRIPGSSTYYAISSFNLAPGASSIHLASVVRHQDTGDSLTWVPLGAAPTDPSFYGDGSEGDVTISADTTITRNMNYRSLTVNPGVTLHAHGYKIFVAGTLTNQGIISADGASGAGGAGNGLSTTPGGFDYPLNEIGISGAGGVGMSHMQPGGRGGPVYDSLGGSGGSGGSGGKAGGAGGDYFSLASLPLPTDFVSGSGPIRIDGGAGGGGGAGGADVSGMRGQIYYGGSGGGGGAGGGVLLIFAKSVDNTNGIISANGGSGGAGGSGSGGGRGGNGGGGGGGVVYLAYESLIQGNLSVAATGGGSLGSILKFTPATVNAPIQISAFNRTNLTADLGLALDLPSWISTTQASILDANEVFSQEYSSAGVLETQTKANHTVTLFEGGRPSMVLDEGGNTLILYSYDAQGNPTRVFLRNARDALPDEVARVRAKIEEERQKALLQLAQAKALAYQEIKSQADSLRSQLSSQISQVQSQINSLENTNVRGSKNKKAKSQALDQGRSVLAQLWNQWNELHRGEADAYARLDLLVQQASDKIESDARAAFEELARKEADLKKEILRQEVSPLVYDRYRRILGRDPNQSEYEYWLAQVDYQSGQTNVEILTIAGIPLTQALASYINAMPELGQRQTYVNIVKQSVTDSLNRYLGMSQAEKLTFAQSLGLLPSELIGLTSEDRSKILAWLASRSLHFGQSAFLALESLLDLHSIPYSREDLATRAILIDILTGVISPLDDGELVISLFSLDRAASLYGLSLAGATLSFQDLKTLFLHSPSSRIIAHINGNHYVIVTGITETSVTYLDPGIGKDKENESVTVTRDAFQKAWQGRVLLEEVNGQWISSFESKRLIDAEAQRIRGAFWGSLLNFIGLILSFTPLAFLTIPFLIAGFVTSVVEGDWISAISSVVAIGFSDFGIGTLLKGVFGGIAGALGNVGRFFGNLYNSVTGFVSKAIDFLPGIGSEFASKTAALIVNTSLFAGVSFGVSRGLTALGVSSELSSFLTDLTAGAVVGALSPLSKAATAAGVTRSGLVQSTLLNAVTLANVGRLGLDLGLDPVFSSLVGLSLGAIQGKVLANPTTSLEQAFKKVLPTAATGLALYGVEKLGVSVGLSPLLSSLIGIPFAGTVSGLVQGLVNPNGGGGPGGIFNSITSALKGLGQSLGIDFGGKTSDPIFGSLLSRDVLGSVESVLGRGGLFSEIFKLLGQAVLSPFNLVNGVVRNVLEGITGFDSLIQSKGIAGALEGLATSIFSRQTLEKILNLGGIASLLGSSSKILTTLMTGAKAQEIQIDSNTSIFFDLLGNFIGKKEAGVTQIGTFGLDRLGKWGLLSGKLFATVLGDLVFAGDVKDGQLAKMTVSDSKGVILEGKPEGQGSIVIAGPDSQSNSSATFWNSIFKLVPLGVSLFFKQGLTRTAEITVETISASLTSLIDLTLLNGFTPFEAAALGAIPEYFQPGNPFREQLNALGVSDSTIKAISLFTGPVSDLFQYLFYQKLSFDIQQEFTKIRQAQPDRPFVPLAYSGAGRPLLDALANKAQNGFDIKTAILVGAPLYPEDTIIRSPSLERVINVFGSDDVFYGLQNEPSIPTVYTSASRSIETINIELLGIDHNEYFYKNGDITTPEQVKASAFIARLTQATLNPQTDLEDLLRKFGGSLREQIYTDPITNISHRIRTYVIDTKNIPDNL